MRAQELIQRKRDGAALAPGDIRALVEAYTRGEVPDYQMAALCMAVFFRGMDATETAALTDAMLRSGDVLDLSDIPGPKIDKHSTGGVGDKVSLTLAPIAAACGVRVPMISGRGLGHTGGTLDKLESIPGFRIGLTVDEFRDVLSRTGCALIGQTDRLAPADRKLYALRDVTATVESIPLIAASIMSKKLAEGIDGLVLDVKVGSGAFMKRRADAEALARTLCSIGRAFGKRVSALLTAMDEPLGRAVGNALEVAEAVEVLHGGGPADYREVNEVLTAEMLVLGGVAASRDEGRAKAREAISSGRAFEKLVEIARAQGADVRALQDPARLPRAPAVAEARSGESGFVQSIDAQAVGLAAMALGAGRARVEDRVDPSVGIVVLKKVGDRVERGEPLCLLHHGAVGAEPAGRVAQRVLSAYRIGDDRVMPGPLLIGEIA